MEVQLYQSHRGTPKGKEIFWGVLTVKTLKAGPVRNGMHYHDKKTLGESLSAVTVETTAIVIPASVNIAVI